MAHEYWLIDSETSSAMTISKLVYTVLEFVNEMGKTIELRINSHML